jgi:hypothetical protein
MSQQINLYQKISRKQTSAFSIEGMAMGLGVILFCALLYFTYVVYQTMDLKQQLEAGNANIASEQAKLDSLNADFSSKRSGLTYEQELKNLEAELSAQREIINALKSGVIGNTQGYSVYMQAFARQIVSGLWLTGFSIEGDAKQMSLSGGVLSPDLVPGYILRLNKEQVMRGKIFTSLHMQLTKVEEGKPATTKYVEFNLQSAVAEEAEE